MASKASVVQRLRNHKFWRERTPREQGLLLTTAATLVLGVIYFALINPALDGRHYWQQLLPQLRVDRAQMQSLAKQLGSAPTASQAVSPKTDRATLERSLTDAGIKPASLEVSDELVRLRWADVSFSELTNWLVRMQREQAWSVTEASVNAKESVDRVDATVALRWLRSSP
ncbi:MAG: type II secretion system protein GspM [Burkholderiaceae bacterium]|jgi:general secretion pathway protein M